MGCRLTTLLDTLSSMQFRTTVLLSFGLETWQIADLLETSEQTVLTWLRDSLRQTGCRDAHELSARALVECENDLYDETRLQQAMEPLQKAAKRVLERSRVQLAVALVN